MGSNVMTEKRLFWREFWFSWGTGVIVGAIFAALVRIPTTPLAMLLLLKDHAQKPLLVGTEAIELTIGLAIAVSCGVLAARCVGLGAPIVEKWLRGEANQIATAPKARPILTRGNICCRSVDPAHSVCISSQSTIGTSRGRETLRVSRRSEAG
jgi:xanthosine utilization system XapX-like protein